MNTGRLKRLRRLSRRRVLAGTVAAASLAATAAALGNALRLGPALFDSAADDEAGALRRESVKVSHLLRRAGFGVSRAEWERYQSLGLEGTLAELIDYGRIDDRRAEALASAVDLNRSGPAVWWLVRLANTRRPLQEKMTFFWHGILTTEISAVVDAQAMVAQNEFVRSHAMGSFRDLLQGISVDRAMMVYLDSDGSEKSAPNENFARELLELFSMGPGHYSEQDVREAARAFTGWVVPRPNPRNVFVLGEPEFNPERFDDGVKTFLGRSGSFRHQDIVDIVVEQPQTAEYIVRRLFAFFVFPGPSDSDVRPFIEVYRKSRGVIRPVVEAMLRSEAFYSPRAYRAMAKTPVEFAVAAIKALGLGEYVPQLLPGRAAALRNMGQVLFDPPNVSGWPGGRAWFASSMLLARLNFLDYLVSFSARPLQDSVELGSAQDALDYFLPFTLDDNLPAAARDALLDYAGGVDAPLDSARLRGLAYLILGSPQFQLS